METNIDISDDDKPVILYSENKATADELACIIFWTGIKENDDNDKKMRDLAAAMSENDYGMISKPLHTKYQTRLTINTKENAEYLYNKYKLIFSSHQKWDWSLFKLSDFKIE